jgi:adenosylcobinamide-GDP ribazoletransferase
VRRQLALLICAIQFLTRLPTPTLKDFAPDWVTRGARYFPLAGQLVGAIGAAVLLAAAQVWPAWIAAVLAIGAGVLATGALHEDGLADTADGLFGGATAEARLAIMKDSRVGTYGVLALILALGLKAGALASLKPMEAAFALVAAHGVGRAAATVTMRLTAYAQAGSPGKWTPAAQGVTTGEASVAVLLALWPLAFLPVGRALAGVVLSGLAAMGLAALARRRLGGHTGDVLGAVEQVAEIGFLIGASMTLG